MPKLRSYVQVANRVTNLPTLRAVVDHLKHGGNDLVVGRFRQTKLDDGCRSTHEELLLDGSGHVDGLGDGCSTGEVQRCRRTPEAGHRRLHNRHDVEVEAVVGSASHLEVLEGSADLCAANKQN